MQPPRPRKQSRMPSDDITTDAASINIQQWLGLIAASMGMFLTSLDITVNVALPDITRSLGTDSQTVQWIIIFYVGSSTGLQLSLGNAADRYGLKRFYLLGLVIYALAVLLIGLAPILSMVFALRVLQAVGNGLIMVAVPALVTNIFPPETRGRALGLMTGIGALGTVAGALGGGVLVDHFGWRAIFLGRVPLCILTVFLSIGSLREAARQDPQAYDLRGTVVLFIGLVSFILFLTLGGRNGWAQPYVLLLLLLSVFSGIAFVYVEKTVPQPVFDLTLFKHRVLVPVVAAAFLMHLAVFVNWFILPFYVSDTLNANAKTLGFLLMLMMIISTVTSPLGGWLSDQMPPAYLTTLALVITMGSMFWFTQLGADSTVTDVTLRMTAVGLGAGLFQAANATLVMNSVPSDQLGTGGALLAMSRSMGTVSSVALMGALFASRLDVHTLALTQQGIVNAAARSQAFVPAFKDTYGVAAVLAGVAVLVSLSYWPRRLGSDDTAPGAPSNLL
ncbi:MFS transporter [Candidatus Entotheonella palauensis]|uniref:MFS transporter n=1 Tax=Candidatus Entotheonella palauensis TaxID=93172 RepID=UPI000B7EECAD|nr:MFS transporter [Candidatus Entotheonella palauensis]